MKEQVSLKLLNQEIVQCRCCTRLVEWRISVALKKIKRFENWEYWGKPVPGFGDENARLLIVGLAPAAHGGNRTGRMFTGDRSGDFLYSALYKSGYANQPTSISMDDGLLLKDCYITASIRCVPPGNNPKRSELLNCRQFLINEVILLRNLKVIIALGKIAFETTLECIEELGMKTREKSIFGHGKMYTFGSELALIASFHPSQRNTFTGKLTEKMFDAIFKRVKEIIK